MGAAGTGDGSMHCGSAPWCQVFLALTMPRRYTRLAMPRWGLNRRLSPPVFIGACETLPLALSPHDDGLGESADIAARSRLQLSKHKSNIHRALNFGKLTECLWIPVCRWQCTRSGVLVSARVARGDIMGYPTIPGDICSVGPIGPLGPVGPVGAAGSVHAIGPIAAIAPDLSQATYYLRGHGGTLAHVLAALGKFRRRHGHWPRRLYLYPETFAALVQDLTPIGFYRFQQRLEIIADLERDLFCSDDAGNVTVYRMQAAQDPAAIDAATGWLDLCSPGGLPPSNAAPSSASPPSPHEPSR